MNRFPKPRRLAVLALVPLLALSMGACSDDDDPVLPAPRSIAEVLSSASNLSTFTGYLEDADLLDALDGTAERTVLAPSDAAFDAVPDSILEALLADDGLFETFLLDHILEGSVPLGEFETGTDVTAEGGSSWSVTVEAGVVTIGGADITDSAEASNGYAHMLDAVLLPVDDGGNDEENGEGDEEEGEG